MARCSPKTRRLLRHRFTLGFLGASTEAGRAGVGGQELAPQNSNPCAASKERLTAPDPAHAPPQPWEWGVEGTSSGRLIYWGGATPPSSRDPCGVIQQKSEQAASPLLPPELTKGRRSPAIPAPHHACPKPCSPPRPLRHQQSQELMMSDIRSPPLPPIIFKQAAKFRP